MWGDRVVVPSVLRGPALRQLHRLHQGIVRTKRLARLHLWWPDMRILTARSKNGACEVCQTSHPNKPASPNRAWPECRVWGRLHLDFAEISQRIYFLVVVDATTGWIEARWTAASSTRSVTEFLTSLFSRYGLPDVIFSDNGPAFTSAEMVKFCELLGIKLVHSAPYYPKSNVLAEAAVKVLEDIMKRLTEPIKLRLDSALQAARHTPNEHGVTPA